MEALANLGVDWKLFLAQAVNFLILLFVLRRFAYRPMLKFLEERTARIDQGLKDAESAHAKLKSVSEEEKKIMVAAREEARDILLQAEGAAKKRDALMLQETKGKIDKMIADADAHLADEKERLVREAKAELSSLVVTATERVLGKTVDAKIDTQLVEAALSKGK